MIEHYTCAVVVTFRPEKEVLRNLARIRAQVRGLVVVDNCSPVETQRWLSAAGREADFTIIQNDENLGIAAALNIGIRWAESKGYQYLILFDQDSTVTDGFTDMMLRFYCASPHREKIAILVPSYTDSRLGTILPALYAKDGSLQVAMSSGSLMPVKIFHEKGWFDESLFIDYVDYEYCLRVRSSGYAIEECKDAVLLHAPGDPQSHRFFGFLFLRTANYSAFRRYYITRNMIWLVRKYWTKYPALCLTMLLNSMKDGLKVILVENRKRQKIHSSLLGFVDGLCGYMNRKNISPGIEKIVR